MEDDGGFDPLIDSLAAGKVDVGEFFAALDRRVQPMANGAVAGKPLDEDVST
jgi:hypothetical protein